MALNSSNFLAISVIFPLLACIAYGLRVWARAATKAKISVDDILIIPALFFVVGIAITMIIGNRFGKMAQHYPMPVGPNGPIYTETLRTYEICQYVIENIAIVSLGCSKLSVLFFYRRIFSVHARFLRFNTGLIVFVILWMMGLLWANIFQCKNPATLWNVPEWERTKCVDSLSFFYSCSITGFFTDLVVLASPIPLILKLKMPVRRRIGVICILQLGAVVCAAGIVRFITFLNIGHGIKAHIMDLTYFTAPVHIWTVIEASLAVVGANLPMLRPLTLQETAPWPLLRSYISQLSRGSGSVRSGPSNRAASEGSEISIELTPSVSGAKPHVEENVV